MHCPKAMLGSFDPEAWAALFEVVAFDRADADDEDDVPCEQALSAKTSVSAPTTRVRDERFFIESPGRIYNNSISFDNDLITFYTQKLSIINPINVIQAHLPPDHRRP
jgi:hypothetical protein